MTRAFLIFLICVNLSCIQKSKLNLEQSPKMLNEQIASELAEMVEIDQIAAYIPQGKYLQLSQAEWNAFKDSVFTSNQVRAEEILDQFGFPGFDRVGETGSSDFWVIVQHSDFNPDFQKRVLELMKVEIKKGNASKRNYALLTDRYRLNIEKKQLFGTQVMYNDREQAIPRPLEDSLNVNSRRAEMDLEPIEEYLNGMTLMHFEMNKEHFKQIGILEPVLHKAIAN